VPLFTRRENATMAETTTKTGRTRIPIELTREQEQVRQVTGKRVAARKLTLEVLEERIAPGSKPSVIGGQV
jgi:hypothetical protein